MGELKFAAQMPQTVAHSILKDFIKNYVDKENLESMA